MANWWANYIRQRARAYGLDPRAVLAVASQEGLGGGVGDQGTSYGPFQLHRGGALPAGRGRQWAESQAGIDYALQRIAGVARGQRGAQAIQSIVSSFERPANPSREIQGAISAYGRGVGTAPSGPAPSGIAQMLGAAQQQAQSGINPRTLLASTLIAANQASSRGQPADYSQLAQLVSAARQPTAPVQSPLSPSSSGSKAGVGPPTGGPSLSFLSPLARQFGLQITSTTEGNHVPGSYHYQRRAEDYGGSPAQMAALQRYALSRPGEFKEAFYTGPGSAPYFVKNGRVYPVSQLNPSVRTGHTNHVHLAR